MTAGFPESVPGDRRRQCGFKPAGGAHFAAQACESPRLRQRPPGGGPAGGAMSGCRCGSRGRPQSGRALASVTRGHGQPGDRSRLIAARWKLDRRRSTPTRPGPTRSAAAGRRQCGGFDNEIVLEWLERYKVGILHDYETVHSTTNARAEQRKK